MIEVAVSQVVAEKTNLNFYSPALSFVNVSLKNMLVFFLFMGNKNKLLYSVGQ